MENNNLENTTNMVVTNEPKKKGNKGIVILIVLVILGVGGYFTYDKVLKDKFFNKEEHKKSEKKKDYQKRIDDYYDYKESVSEVVYNYKLKDISLLSEDDYKFTKEKDYDIYLNGTKHIISIYYTDDDDNDKCRKERDPDMCVRHQIILFDDKGSVIYNPELYNGEPRFFFNTYGDHVDFKNLISKSRVIKDNDGKEYYELFLEGISGRNEIAIIDENGTIIFNESKGDMFYVDDSTKYSYEITNDGFKVYIPTESYNTEAIEVIGKVVDGQVKLEYSKLIRNGEWAGQE